MDEILKESIVDFINKIIEPISVGGIFDSHMIIQQMLKKNSDLFYRFIIETDSSETEYVHSQLAKIIGQVSSVKNNDIKSWSENIHGHVTACTAWAKK